MAVLKTITGDRPLARGAAIEIDEATIRFAGDASDGMHLAGSQFATASSLSGNRVCTLPDPPAEIRAHAGTLANVAGFQVHFSRRPHHSPGDVVDTLIAMNPAALQAHLADLAPGGILVANADAFTPEELEKAGFADNPLVNGSLNPFRILAVPMSQFNREAVARVNLIAQEADRCKSFFALGVAFWLYSRPLDPTLKWIRDKYDKNPPMIEASTRSLMAGFHHGETNEAVPAPYRVGKADLPAGRYRSLSGTEALACGLLAAAHQTRAPLVFSCFPQAPATELLHHLCEQKYSGVNVVQAEDDLASLQVALGTALGGGIGVTCTSGPGLSLGAEALGLAVMSELPCVLIDVQRAGPSTGMPTKTEQADLLQALFGRHGECPLVVLAAATPADGFSLVLEAVRLATRYMTPVILLTDVHLAMGAESWRIPGLHELPALPIQYAEPASAPSNGQAPFWPYQRDDKLVRPWAVPGTPGLEHCTGGLEKENRSGAVSFDPFNHEAMVRLRADKIAGIAADVLPLAVDEPKPAELLVLGWGSTFGAIQTAVERCRRQGLAVACAHLRHLHPMPANTGAVLKRYRKILVPELNAGQLCKLLRANYFVDAVSLSKVQGRPFLASEIQHKIEELLQ